MSLLVPAFLWVAVVSGAAMLAVHRPAVALRAGTWLVTGLVLIWLLLCGLGLAAQVRQGGGIHAVVTETPFHGAHRVLSHAVVMLAWAAAGWMMPVAVERAIRTGGVGMLLLQLPLAAATLILVLLSAFTGHLAAPPVTEASYLRFRILHTVLVPLMGTLSLLAWRVVASRYATSSTVSR
jgi:hypothetical protein